MGERPPVGTRVRWTSQGGGRASEKRGVVIYSGDPMYLPRGRFGALPSERLPEEVRSAYNYQVMFESVSGGVIVRVEHEEGRPRYYAPRPQWLETES